jgi:hypothetical protein
MVIKPIIVEQTRSVVKAVARRFAVPGSPRWYVDFSETVKRGGLQNGRNL